MKESQLVAKMKEIETRLKESQIVEKCYKVARDHGEGETQVSTYHTTLAYSYKDENLKIRLGDGGPMGGGRLTVDYDGRTVLSCDRDVDDKKEYAHYPRANYFTIITYLPGAWEKKIESILEPKKEPPKPEPPKDPNIDPVMLKELRKKFRL